MKKVTLLLVILVLLLVLLPAGMASARNPLRCEITYTFVGAPDSQGRFILWEGNITGDIEGTIRWWGDPFAFRYTGQASHYGSSWEIVDGDGNVLLAGEGSGTTTARHEKNSNWRANGVITEANGPFENWLGGHDHQSGHFTWQVVQTPDGPMTIPEAGAGTLRVN